MVTGSKSLAKQRTIPSHSSAIKDDCFSVNNLSGLLGTVLVYDSVQKFIASNMIFKNFIHGGVFGDFFGCMVSLQAKY
jgi:hypothetical protein